MTSLDCFVVQKTGLDKPPLLSEAMKTKTSKTGMAVGINKGHVTTKRVSKTTKKQGGSERTKFVRGIVREVAGFSPYEKRIMELLKTNQDKRARRLAKRRLGALSRGKKKIEELANVIAESRRAA